MELKESLFASSVVEHLLCSVYFVTEKKDIHVEAAQVSISFGGFHTHFVWSGSSDFRV